MKIENALIKSTHLGLEDHGIMSFMLDLELSVGCQGFGGWAMDEWSEGKQKRLGSAFGLECVRQILDVVGVDRWERLPGKHIRIRRNGDGWNARIDAIGHILEDKWFDPAKLYEEYK